MTQLPLATNEPIGPGPIDPGPTFGRIGRDQAVLERDPAAFA